MEKVADVLSPTMNYILNSQSIHLQVCCLQCPVSLAIIIWNILVAVMRRITKYSIRWHVNWSLLLSAIKIWVHQNRVSSEIFAYSVRIRVNWERLFKQPKSQHGEQLVHRSWPPLIYFCSGRPLTTIHRKIWRSLVVVFRCVAFKNHRIELDWISTIFVRDEFMRLACAQLITWQPSICGIERSNGPKIWSLNWINCEIRS